MKWTIKKEYIPFTILLAEVTLLIITGLIVLR